MKIPSNFMDAVHQWTFVHDKFQAVRFVRARYRAKLRQAQRFVLDDDAVRLICSLSHDYERLQGWSFLARLPYDQLWVEFNLHAKIQAMIDLGTIKPFDYHASVSPVMGLLFYLDGDTTKTRWICHLFVRNAPHTETDWNKSQPKGDWAGIGPLAFVFDPEGSPLAPLRGSQLWRSPTLSLRPDFPKVPITMRHRHKTPEGHDCHTDIQADPEVLTLGLYAWDDEHQRIFAPDWLVSRAATIIDPWADAGGFQPREALNRIALRECNELRGQLRWLIALLAAINGLPKDVKPIHPTGRQTTGMHVLPYFQHSTIAINLPREDRIRRAHIMLDRQGRNAKRAWHRVIGHWRIIDRGKPLPGYYCRHLPAMVEEGLGICEKCEMLIRWIPAHERGDPTIGMVDHTYQVHAKRQTAQVELGKQEASAEPYFNAASDQTASAGSEGFKNPVNQ